MGSPQWLSLAKQSAVYRYCSLRLPSNAHVVLLSKVRQFSSVRVAWTRRESVGEWRWGSAARWTHSHYTDRTGPDKVRGLVGDPRGPDGLWSGTRVSDKVWSGPSSRIRTWVTGAEACAQWGRRDVASLVRVSRAHHLLPALDRILRPQFHRHQRPGRQETRLLAEHTATNRLSLFENTIDVCFSIFSSIIPSHCSVFFLLVVVFPSSLSVLKLLMSPLFIKGYLTWLILVFDFSEIPEGYTVLKPRLNSQIQYHMAAWCWFRPHRRTQR